jgi:hypothetical protein
MTIVIPKATTQGFVGRAVVVMHAVISHWIQKKENTMMMIVAGDFKDEDLIVGSKHYVL